MHILYVYMHHVHIFCSNTSIIVDFEYDWYFIYAQFIQIYLQIK